MLLIQILSWRRALKDLWLRVVRQGLVHPLFLQRWRILQTAAHLILDLSFQVENARTFSALKVVEVLWLPQTAVKNFLLFFFLLSVVLKVIFVAQTFQTSLMSLNLLFVHIDTEKFDELSHAPRKLGLLKLLSLQCNHATEQFCHLVHKVSLVAFFWQKNSAVKKKDLIP